MRFTMLRNAFKEMIKTPFEVMNDKADAKRPVTYGDFAILSSAKSNNDKIESIFAAYGIPVNVQRKAQSYFKRNRDYNNGFFTKSN